MIRYYARLRGVVERRDFEGAARRGVASSWRLRLALRLVGVCVAAVAAVSAVFCFFVFLACRIRHIKEGRGGRLLELQRPLIPPFSGSVEPSPFKRHSAPRPFRSLTACVALSFTGDCRLSGSFYWWRWQLGPSRSEETRPKKVKPQLREH